MEENNGLERNVGYVIDVFKKGEEECYNLSNLIRKTRLEHREHGFESLLNLNAARAAIKEAEKRGLIRETIVDEIYELVE